MSEEQYCVFVRPVQTYRSVIASHLKRLQRDSPKMDILRSSEDPHSFAIPELARVVDTHLELTVDFNQKVIKGKAILTIEKDLSINEIILDNLGLVISRVTDINGKRLNYHVGNSCALGNPFYVQLPKTVDISCKIQIEYETSPNSPALHWLTPAQTADGEYPFLLSNNKLIYARAWFPCQDTPSVKFTYSATISVLKDFRVVMSALLQNTFEGPDINIYEFCQKKLVPSYAVVIAVGSLQAEQLNARTNIFVEENFIFGKHVTVLLVAVQLMLGIAESLCGPYLWDRYDICVLPPSIAHFEIECPCVTFISPTLIGGDLSHVSLLSRNISQSWAGNLVTCSNYEHLWLNKSFSIFISRKIICEVLRKYDDMNFYLRKEGLKNINNTVEKYGNLGLLNCLVPNLTGILPHNAIKYVSYERGCVLLNHLENILGGPLVFQPFFHFYFNNFACRSINTTDWMNYLYRYFSDKEEILNCVKWHSLLYSIPSTSILPGIMTALENVCFSLTETWPERLIYMHEDSHIDYQKNFYLRRCWDVERLLFLNYLHSWNTDLSREKLSSITPYFAFNMRNAETRFVWLLLCIRVRCPKKVKLALKFAIEYCSPNYACPIFQHLYEWKEMRPIAIEMYIKNKEKMLYKTQEKLDIILHLTS